MSTAEVDVLVPVHAASRPVRALAESVFAGMVASCRLIVVAHNTARDEIAVALGPFADDPRVELLELQDGIRSPAGPLRLALERVSAPFFTKVDSDDRLVPGALDTWLAVARRHGAEAVVPRMSLDGVRGNYPTPPRRPGRRVLDPGRDRLVYRTSTMGLFAARLAPAAEPTPFLRVGEDIVPSVRLWYTAAGIIHAPHRAAYLIGAGATDRTTETELSAHDELAFADVLVTDRVFAGLTETERVRVVAKMLRVHVSASARRAAARGWRDGDLATLSRATRLLIDGAPAVRSILSSADVDFVDSLMARDPSPFMVAQFAAARGRYLHPRALSTQRLSDILARDAPPRFLAASVMARLFG